MGTVVGERNAWVLFAAACGMASSALTPVLVLAATALSGSFDWGSSALSDMGVGEQARLFNGAVFTGGVLLACFSAGLGSFLGKGPRARAGALLLAAAGACLSLVGIFTLEYHVPHIVVSGGYMLLVPAGMILAGLAAGGKWARIAGLASGTAAYIAIIVAPALIYGIGIRAGFAVPELLEMLPISIWTFFTSARLIATGSLPQAPTKKSPERR